MFIGFPLGTCAGKLPYQKKLVNTPLDAVPLEESYLRVFTSWLWMDSFVWERV